MTGHQSDNEQATLWSVGERGYIFCELNLINSMPKSIGSLFGFKPFVFSLSYE